MAQKQLSIALVDDSKSVIAQLERIVNDLDDAQIVGSARNGTEAIRLVAEVNPDLVLMDIVMPDMDGLAALRMLHSQNPDQRIAMLSSVGGMTSKAEEAFRLGAIQVLSKPLDREALEALIAQELERL
jgi:YesN/AraC family two-component response regulator